MSDIKENSLPGDQNSIEIEVDDPKLEVASTISNNPTRLIGTDADPGPQMPQINQETLLDPALTLDSDSAIAQETNITEETADSAVPESIIEPVAEINPDQGLAPASDFKPLPEAPIAEPGSELDPQPGTHPTPEMDPKIDITSESTPTSEPIEPVEPIEAAEKYHQVLEAMYKAPDLNALLAAYHEMSEKNRSGEMGLVRLQEAMAENMARLGHVEKAIDFTLLAGQTANNSRFDESVKHLADLLDKTLPHHITNLLEGLQELNRQSQNRN